MNKPLFPDIVVNGTTLSAADIAAEAQNHHAPKGKPGLAWRKAARALAIRHLLLEEAGARGLSAAPRELSPGRTETPQEALIRALLEQVLDPAPPTEGELRAVYDRDPGAYRAPSLFQPAHILFAAAPGDEPARAQARARADAALAELQKSPGRFGDIARAQSDCSSRDAGGELGQLSSGDTVPEFEAALRTAPVGEVYDRIVETRYGLHILRLDGRAEGAVLPFSAVRERLAEAAEKAGWTRAAHDYVSELLRDADIQGMDMGIAA